MAYEIVDKDYRDKYEEQQQEEEKTAALHIDASSANNVNNISHLKFRTQPREKNLKQLDLLEELERDLVDNDQRSNNTVLSSMTNELMHPDRSHTGNTGIRRVPFTTR